MMTKRWSFSMLECFEQCEKKYEYRYVQKLPGAPPGPDDPRERGSRFHAEIENYITRQTDELHQRFKPFASYIEDIRNTPGIGVEQLVSLSRDWIVVPNDSAKAWLRYKMDAVVPTPDPEEVRLIDWKSGRVYHKKHFDQASIYALGAFAENPAVLRVQTEFVYLDQRQLVEHVIPATSAPNLRDSISKRVAWMHDSKTFREQPSKLCAWCDYSVSKGGPCPQTGK